MQRDISDTTFVRLCYGVLHAIFCALILLSLQPCVVQAAARGPIAPGSKEVDSYTITQRGDSFRVNISYPRVGNAVADTELAIWASDQADTFIKSVRMIPTSIPMPYELTITYKIFLASSRVVSVVFFISTSMGGMHPEPGLATFIYERNDGRRLSYSDLFLQQNGLLHTLSETSLASLQEQLGSRAVASMLEAGTAPNNANFDLFVLVPDGVRIYFPPYQVAQYSEGYLTVTIPLDKLDEFKPQKTFWDKE